MPARFDDVIPFFGDEVVAIGPLHSGDELKEVCAWIYQPTADAGRDAAATEMHFVKPHDGIVPIHDEPDDDHTAHPHFQQDKGVRWLLPLRRISEAPFAAGPAFAVAIALVVDMEDASKERVVWWGQPVDLWKDEPSVVAAHKTGALECAPLNEPAELPKPADPPILG
jgi:hypothetical protein